jgi:hypothetical protein
LVVDRKKLYLFLAVEVLRVAYERAKARTSVEDLVIIAMVIVRGEWCVLRAESRSDLKPHPS